MNFNHYNEGYDYEGKFYRIYTKLLSRDKKEYLLGKAYTGKQEKLKISVIVLK